MSSVDNHRTGGPVQSSIGIPDSTEQPDSQKNSAANATGTASAGTIHKAPDVEQSGGKQPSDPVQND